MKVLDHEPYRWFLLEDSGGLLLDISCHHSFISYNVLIQLTPDEIQEYRQRGRDYLNWLSEDVHNSAPILKVSKSIYKGRNISPVVVKCFRPPSFELSSRPAQPHSAAVLRYAYAGEGRCNNRSCSPLLTASPRQNTDTRFPAPTLFSGS